MNHDSRPPLPVIQKSKESEAERRVAEKETYTWSWFSHMEKGYI
jgi:hypothetical protein